MTFKVGDRVIFTNKCEYYTKSTDFEDGALVVYVYKTPGMSFPFVVSPVDNPDGPTLPVRADEIELDPSN